MKIRKNETKQKRLLKYSIQIPQNIFAMDIGNIQVSPVEQKLFFIVKLNYLLLYDPLKIRAYIAEPYCLHGQQVLHSISPGQMVSLTLNPQCFVHKHALYSFYLPTKVERLTEYCPQTHSVLVALLPEVLATTSLGFSTELLIFQLEDYLLCYHGSI